MAISPKDTELSEKEIKNISRLEKFIDDVLLTRNPPGDQIRIIEIELFGFAQEEPLTSSLERSNAAELVRARYLPVVTGRFEKAGWHVEKTDEDDDEIFLSLSPEDPT
jgi:hypothetical protein